MEKFFAKPTAAIVTFAAIIVRLIPHPANFTPLGASAIFGAKNLNRPWNYVAPLFVLFITDLFLGFHATMPYVYGAFIISVFIAEIILRSSTSTSRLVGLAVANSFIFYLVTNFGVWIQGSLYPPTLIGLTESYVMGLPFLRNMLIADVMFTVGVFKVFELAINNPAIERFDNQVSNWLLKTVR